MKDTSIYVKKLIGIGNLNNIKAEEILGQICTNLYEKSNYQIRDNDIFDNLPIIIKDIILLIDFDTELNMNGILGFLENSTGLYLDDTIEALERIGATEDYEILREIKGIMLRYSLDTKKVRRNVNKGIEYEITNFSRTHGQEYNQMAEEISIAADDLYLYHNERNIFKNLMVYVDLNKDNLINEISK